MCLCVCVCVCVWRIWFLCQRVTAPISSLSSLSKGLTALCTLLGWMGCWRPFDLRTHVNLEKFPWLEVTEYISLKRCQALTPAVADTLKRRLCSIRNKAVFRQTILALGSRKTFASFKPHPLIGPSGLFELPCRGRCHCRRCRCREQQNPPTFGQFHTMPHCNGYFSTGAASIRVHVLYKACRMFLDTPTYHVREHPPSLLSTHLLSAGILRVCVFVCVLGGRTGTKQGSTISLIALSTCCDFEKLLQSTSNSLLCLSFNCVGIVCTLAARLIKLFQLLKQEKTKL